MTTLPLKFSCEADIWAENYPNTINLQCELDLYARTTYQREDLSEEKIKAQLAKTLQNKLYGPINEKLAEAQYFFMSSLSPLADHEKALKLFKELYAAIPKINL